MPIGLQRFEVWTAFRPNFNYLGIGFEANLTFAVFFAAQELIDIKIWLSTIKDLYIGYHLPK